MRGTKILVMASLLTLAPDLPAKEIEGVTFSDQVRAGGVALRLNEVGLLRYRYIIKAYVAGLYLGESATAADVLADVPKRLEIEYFYAI